MKIEIKRNEGKDKVKFPYVITYQSNEWTHKMPVAEYIKLSDIIFEFKLVRDRYEI